MKIIQALVVLFAVVGCLALALGGFYIYSTSKSGEPNFLTKLTRARTAETTGTATAAPPAPAAAKSEYASVIKEYAPTPTPAPVQPQTQSAALPAAGGQQVAVRAGAGQVPVGAPAGQAPTALAVKTPAPNEGKIRSWPTGKKWVALTYDDGPHPEWTPKMIELLKSKNVKATFFLLGNMIEKHPDVGRSIVANGFEVGNHTYSHPDFNKSSMTKEKIRDELVRTKDLIAQYITASPVRNMRPPFGNTGPKKLEPVCEELGLNIVCWNIDTDDWRSGTTADEMANNIMKNLTDGSIILMHDKHEKTYDCTAKVIDQIRAKGYEFVTVSELLGLNQPGAAPTPDTLNPAAAAPTPASAAAAAPETAPVAEAPGAAAPADGGLPVPAAAQSPATAGPLLDSSKITQPPPQK